MPYDIILPVVNVLLIVVVIMFWNLPKRER